MNRTEEIYNGDTLVETIVHDVDWKTIRAQRNYELKSTDWLAVKDRTMPQSWKDFRQALRDLPQTYDDPNDAADNWPVMPDA